MIRKNSKPQSYKANNLADFASISHNQNEAQVNDQRKTSNSMKDGKKIVSPSVESRNSLKREVKLYSIDFVNIESSQPSLPLLQ
jgi:hypothetical protein